MSAANAYRSIGTSLPGVDGVAKLTGGACYAGDLRLPGMLHGKILRSPHAHARILRIETDAARALPGVHAVVTAADLAGCDPFYGMYIRDQPVLARDRVRYVGDPVAAVAAVDEPTALAALRLIRVAYDALPAVIGLDAALAADAPALFEERHVATLPPPGNGSSWEAEPSPNTLYVHRYGFGDVAEAEAGAAEVFEDSFGFARLSHYTLEPHVALAQWTDQSAVEVWSNNQDPFLLQADIARIFALTLPAVRFHTPYVGGGFGAKSYCKTEPIAVLLAREAGRPVRLALGMDESMLTTCEHAARLVLRTGIDAAGRLVSRSARIWLDGGAYADGSPSVAARVATRLCGPYRWTALQAEVQVVRTNTIPAGSFRGFGAAHVTWASESQVDMVARRRGLDPVALRLGSFARLGQEILPNETPLDVDLAAGLEVVAARMRGQARRRGHGIGFAVGLKSAGTGHRSGARVRIPASGPVEIGCGVSEIGQATRTAMTQIVAEVLALPPERITVPDADTAATPYESGTHASSGLTVAGLAVQRAATAARQALLAAAAVALGCAEAALEYRDGLLWQAGRALDPASLLPGQVFSGDGEVAVGGRSFFWMPVWTAAEVAVDEETGAVRVHRLVNAVEVGTAINPQRCLTQAEGGAVQGLGQALFEDLAYAGGTPVAAEPWSYRVPRLSDLPEHFETIVLEQGHGPGPFGAKGVGEAGNLAVPAAIANAIADAVGLRVTTLPLRADRILAALQAGDAQPSAR